MRFFNVSSEELRTILADGLGVSRQKTHEFWLARLNRNYGAMLGLENQIKYVASLLTRFSMLVPDDSAQTLTIPKMVHLAEFENCDELQGFPVPPDLFEDAGQRLLFLSGFEEKDVLKKIGRIEVTRMGSFFFLKASAGQKREILLTMSNSFGDWQHRLSFLNYQLIKNWVDLTREARAIIKIPRV